MPRSGGTTFSDVRPHDVAVWPEIESVFTGAPTVYMYDRVPGGIGFSKRLYNVHQQLLASAGGVVTRCACEHGCPSCVGPDVLDATERQDVARSGWSASCWTRSDYRHALPRLRRVEYRNQATELSIGTSGLPAAGSEPPREAAPRLAVESYRLEERLPGTLDRFVQRFVVRG